MRISLIIISVFFFFHGVAQKVVGTIYNDKGDVLPYATITIKGTSMGVSANNKAKFSFTLPVGNHVLVCQHVGYESVEKSIQLADDLEVDFILSEQKLLMKEVIIKKGEDPAYEIIRQAIKKRPYYNAQVNGFDCDLYGKDMIKLRNLPDRILGQKIPKEDRKQMGVDSSGKGIIYLSESISKIYSQRPNKFKMEVSSSRVSGSGDFGFTFPAFISLYNNNVTVFSDRLNPRGFISPIAEGAIKFYKYKFLGTFFENDKAINVIRVTPRRNYEPLFSGTINITDDDWRIHSCNLILTKTSQLEILDTLQITQQYVPVGNDVWRVKSQLLYFNFKMFQIDAIGNFLSVYSNYNINPIYDKKLFDKIIIKYDTAVNKKTVDYWNAIRPVPLEEEEQRDYKVKDSIYLLEKDSLFSKRNIDSLKKNQGKIKPLSFIIGGLRRTHYSQKNTFRWGIDPLLMNTQFNTAEGVVTQLAGYYDQFFKKSAIRLSIRPTLRYGFGNTHVNSWVDVSIRKRKVGLDEKINRNTWFFSGGKRVSQYNKELPITPLVNTVSTLFYGKNYLKTYENYFGKIGVNKVAENGMNITIQALYEDRMPLFNTTLYTIHSSDSIHLTENYPVERVPLSDIVRHQAVMANIEVSFKPGQRFIQFPKNKIPIGSKYPTFTFSYTKGINKVFGSDVDFDKWKIGMNDDKNFKLAGLFKYKVVVGGFLNNKSVFVQDFQHFNGEPLKAASEYVNSFQLASSYGNSTTARFFSLAHIEHHFNGLLTNKIPLFNRLNWNLVAGSNANYINSKSNYAEWFVGLENLFKIFRIDFVNAYQNGTYQSSALVIGAGGILGGSVTNNSSNGPSDRSVNMSF